MSTDRPPIAWIIETKSKTTKATPYMTLKPEVAEKRAKAGDHVTPYRSKNEPAEEEEL